MKRDKILKFLLLGIAVVCFFAGLIYWYAIFCEQRLKDSLDLLVDNVLKSQYEILDENLGRPGPDLNGYWMISVDEDFVNRLKLAKEFSLADSADFQYYVKVFNKNLIIHKPFDGFELYRAEMSLGDGSICEDYPCNIEVLVKKGSKRVYVGISKI